MRILNVEWKWNVPNTLSLLRIALVPCFTVLYMRHLDVWAFVVLLISGATDCFDGYLARRLGQVTDCGKLLDPLSDKLTQVMVVICLTTRYPEMLPLTVICFTKELCQGIGGMILLRNHCEVRGAKWFGKVSTVVFYGCMLAIVLWHDRLLQNAPWALILLVLLDGLTMLCAFIGYLRLFIQIHRESRTKGGTAVPGPASDDSPVSEQEPEKG